MARIRWFGAFLGVMTALCADAQVRTVWLDDLDLGPIKQGWREPGRQKDLGEHEQGYSITLPRRGVLLLRIWPEEGNVQSSRR